MYHLRNYFKKHFSSVSVSHHRVMLFQISEDVTAPELNDLKFFLNRELSRCKLADSVVRPGVMPRFSPEEESASGDC